jgi:hypothetical protein
MEFIDYVTYVVVWIMGAVYGWYARERQAKRVIDRFMINFEEAVSEPDTKLIPITIEKNNNVFYVWNKDTHTFMGQGKSRRELEEVLAKGFPDTKFMADKESLKVLNESL